MGISNIINASKQRKKNQQPPSDIVVAGVLSEKENIVASIAEIEY